MDKFINNPTVSIIMATYNAEKTIGDSIRSVIAQTYKDWELIVVDDCSQDSTASVVKAIAGDAAAADIAERRAGESGPRIILHSNDKNRGVSGARNIGVGLARGEWIAVLDSDDLWREDKLDKQMRFIKETGADISYTATSYIDPDGNVSGYVLHAEKEFTYKGLLGRNLMSCSSVIVRKGLILHTLFPEGESELHEDYASWLPILREVKCAYGLDEPLLLYRLSKSSKTGSRVRSGMMTFNTYRHIGYGYVSAALLTMRYAVHSISKRAMIKLMMR